MESAQTSRREPRALLERARLDRLSLVGLAVGLVAMLQPWWSAGFRGGFFLLLAATVLQIVAGHVRGTAGRRERE